MGQATAGADTASAEGTAAWAPFRHRLFAAMWGAQFVSNTGGWMQTVAAQWLMLDLVNRRRFLLVTQTFMMAAAAALGALAIAGLVTPWALLALLFLAGIGQALTSPTWQTLQPELVAPAERTQAISLGAVNQTWRDASQPGVILEQFIVASWAEHQRQHERITRRDQDRLDEVQMLAAEGTQPTVTHWLTARPWPQT